MESVYAALLLHKSKKKITEANLEKVLTAAGVEADKAQITKLVTGLKSKNIDDIIELTNEVVKLKIIIFFQASPKRFLHKDLS